MRLLVPAFLRGASVSKIPANAGAGALRIGSSAAAILATALTLSACAGSREVPSPPPAPQPSAHPPVASGADSSAHYRVYTGDGRPASLDEIISAMAEADVVLIGETHDDVVAHLLQARLLEAAHTHYGANGARRPALSLEMFARDVQYILDEYLDGLVTERHFLSSTNAWSNYDTDYRPLVEFARAHGLPVIAANAPRRYVNLVSRLGPESLEDLSERARQAIAPLPYPGPSDIYRAQWEALMEEMTPAAHSDSAGGAHGAPAAGTPSFMIEAQALWDATMAHSIVEHLAEDAAALVLHLAGGFHVERGTGIPEAIAHYHPEARILAVAMRPAETFTSFDTRLHATLGDFVILTDTRRTATRNR